MAEDKGGKKPHKNKPTSTKYKFYSADGKRTQKNCPRCGPGIFLADNSGRLYCGKCHYTEFMNKAASASVSAKK